MFPHEIMEIGNDEQRRCRYEKFVPVEVAVLNFVHFQTDAKMIVSQSASSIQLGFFLIQKQQCIWHFLQLLSYNCCFRVRRFDPGGVVNGGLGNDSIGFHESNELIWDFSQDLFGQMQSGRLRIHASFQEIAKRHKLHNIPGCHLAIRGRQPNIIPIKFIHGIEIGIADTDNNNG